MSSAKMATILSWGKWIKPGIQQSPACSSFPTDTYFNQSNPGDNPRSTSRVLARTLAHARKQSFRSLTILSGQFLVPRVIWASG